MSRASRRLNRESGRYINDVVDTSVVDRKKRNSYYGNNIQTKKEILDKYKERMSIKEA